MCWVFWPRGMWDLSCLNQASNPHPLNWKANFYHWITRKVPESHLLSKKELHLLSSKLYSGTLRATDKLPHVAFLQRR